MTAPKRGRPAKGQALSGAERQRRYRARLSVTDSIGDDKSPIPIFVTRDEKSGNPEHQTLFVIPQCTSECTALMVRTLPQAETITGDRELDAVIWLGTVCKTATDPAALDQAVEAASRIKTPAKELEARYSAWLSRQPGSHPFAVALGSIGIADIAHKAERARERITRYLEGMAAFGSLAAALEPTPAEAMVLRTVRLPDNWNGWSTLTPDAFAAGVNPATLTEAVSEIRYWQWLYRVRDAMSRTEHPGGYGSEPRAECSAREQFAESLLLVIAPRDRTEAIGVADALRDGLIDIGSVDDGERRAAVLDRLLRSLP